MFDIDLADYLTYFAKVNRKRIEKAFDGVQFEKFLLSKAEDTGIVPHNPPFERSKRDLKLHQDKIKKMIYEYL